MTKAWLTLNIRNTVLWSTSLLNWSAGRWVICWYLIGSCLLLVGTILTVTSQDRRDGSCLIHLLMAWWPAHLSKTLLPNAITLGVSFQPINGEETQTLRLYHVYIPHTCVIHICVHHIPQSTPHETATIPYYTYSMWNIYVPCHTSLLCTCANTIQSTPYI